MNRLILLLLGPMLILGGLATPANAASGCDRVRVATAAQAVTAETQLRLGGLGVPLTVDGALGRATKAATKAWETRNALPADGKISPSDLTLLRQQTSGEWSVRIDLDRQAMQVARAGQTVTLPVSTGSGQMYGTPPVRAVTPTGKFTIIRRIEGMRQSPLGCLQKPLYFLRGWAIHGGSLLSRSHGCVRVTMPAIEALQATLSNGTPITVVGTNPPVR